MTTETPIETGLAQTTELKSTEEPPEAIQIDPAPLDRTLIATWRGHDPTRAVTLQWLTRNGQTAKSASLQLTAEGVPDVSTDPEIASFGPSDWSRVRADLRGLEPDTEYEIRIANHHLGYTVKSAPDTLDEAVVFAEGGDIGTAGVVPQLHQQAASWDPLFALVGGDLAYANGQHSDRWLEFLSHWHEHMQVENRLIPIVAAIGNHEVQGGMHGTPADAPYYYSLFDNTERDHAYWTFDVGDYLSIPVLDTNHSTPIPGEQIDWFSRTLDPRRDRPHLMAAYHVPAYPSAKPIAGAGRARKSIRENIPPVLERYEVDVAFEHDDHAYKRTHLLRDGEPNPDGVLYLADGAWGKGPREIHSPDERPYLATSVSTLNVIRVEIRPDGTQRYKAVDENGQVIDTYSSG